MRPCPSTGTHSNIAQFCVNASITFASVLLLLPSLLGGQIESTDPTTGNAPIVFYRRVANQGEIPLSDAIVQLRVLVGYTTSSGALGTRYDRTKKTTDVNGEFMLTGSQGHSVEIESIIKTGYSPSRIIKKLYPYSWSAKIFHPNQNTPVVFVLRENGKKLFFNG